MSVVPTEELAYFAWEIHGGGQDDGERNWREVEEMRHRIIEEKAYFKWLTRERPFGDAMADWLEAESEVNGDSADHLSPSADYLRWRLTREWVAEYAYFSWVDRGRPADDALTDWYAAEEGPFVHLPPEPPV
jgi:sugar (pentulose or hexulose) kinase